MPIPSDLLDEIQKTAIEEWPNDKDMQKYTIQEEIEAYRSFEAIDFSGISESEKQNILSEAKEYLDSWQEIANSVESEVEALIELNNFSRPGISEDLYKEWLCSAEEEHGMNYVLQLDYIESKVRQYEKNKETRKEIDPIKQLLINLESIVGNECYNSNIQNYGSWGVLESEGRSFRYPVKFFDGKNEHKEWSVKSGIPSEELITGYYPFGANELNIYRALYKVLKYLEMNHDLKLPKT